MAVVYSRDCPEEDEVEAEEGPKPALGSDSDSGENARKLWMDGSAVSKLAGQERSIQEFS
jgi:hypothetical protein